MINTDVTIRPGAAVAPAASGQKAERTNVTSAFAGLFRNAVSGASGNLDEIFTKASERYGVPVNLLKAVAKAESNFRPDAVSSCGAQGVMQLMPSTARSLGVDDAFDPEQNIMGGAKYLGGLLDRYGDPKLALAAYNAGSGNVAKYGGIPPFQETRNYVERVMGYAGEDISLPDLPLDNSVSSSASLLFPAESGEAGLAGISFTSEDYAEFLRLLAQQMKQSALSTALSAADIGSLYGSSENNA